MQTLTLPSGKIATIRTGKARDLVKAQMMTQAPEELSLAVASLLCEIDGKPITLEDVGDLDLSDFVELAPFLGLVPRMLPVSALPSPDSPAGVGARSRSSRDKS